MQVLDDLFGHFIATVNLLRPKVVIAENVKGMIFGNARGYVKEIFDALKALGYECQLYLLNASHMGVPQRRERVFFIANRIGKRIQLSFNEEPVSLYQAISEVPPRNPRLMSPLSSRNWRNVAVGKGFGGSVNTLSNNTNTRSDPKRPACTLTATKSLAHWSEPRFFQQLEINRIQTFPDDFDFSKVDPNYVCGMSVPPYMMQRVALEVYKQIFMTQDGNGMEAEDA